MDARLESSTQWSPFPKELCQNAAVVLQERFSEEYDIEGAQFVVEGQIYPNEILGRYGLRFKDQLKQLNFEISLEYDNEKDNALELIQTSMDVVEHLWIELLEDDLNDDELVNDWEKMPHEKQTYYFRYSTTNSLLEEEADKLLEEYEKKLIYEVEKPEESEAAPDSKTTVH